MNTKSNETVWRLNKHTEQNIINFLNSLPELKSTNPCIQQKAQEIFNNLQTEFGDYGEYAITKSPEFDGRESYLADALTLTQIVENIANGNNPQDTLLRLCWDVTNPIADDLEGHCNWDNYYIEDK